jgi:hypothetical protein
MNDSSHNFVFQDEDARCIECDCRPGGTAARKPCASLTDNVACSHPSIARCEETIPWCTDCHQYIDQQTGKPSTAPTLARDGKPYFKQSTHREAVELRFDADSGRYL